MSAYFYLWYHVFLNLKWKTSALSVRSNYKKPLQLDTDRWYYKFQNTLSPGHKLINSREFEVNKRSTPILIILFFGTKESSHWFMLLKLHLWAWWFHNGWGELHEAPRIWQGTIYQGPCPELPLAHSLSKQVNGSTYSRQAMTKDQDAHSNNPPRS